MFTFANDIAPLFRPHDIACMKSHHVLLADANWMCIPANAQRVYQALEEKEMPPDGPWSDDWIAKFKQWMDDGYQP
ncbi:MAG: hypothetical protein P4M09_00195 [Devosia sp.]|nr:hypothetical protein [Devosia sp.]